MITSFSRLFRQIFGGSRAQPVTEAPTRDIGADREAREAAEHRENLKRAMEVAFATPTATADEPVAAPPPAIAALQAAAEEAATAIVAQGADVEPAHEALEAPEPEMPAAEEVVEPIAAAVEVSVEQPAAAELPPAIELAEVEEATEHDVEVVEWDVAKLAADPVEPPALEEHVAEAVEAVEAVEDVAVSEAEDVAQPPTAAAEEAVVETTADEEPAPALTEEFVAAATKPKRSKKAKAPAKKKSATTKKKAPAKKTADLPEDAVWLSDAIAFSLKGEWVAVWTPPEDASGAERLEAFREKAAAGEIVVWGRPESGDTWEPVKAAYWKTALVEPLSFLMGRENVVTDPSTSKAKKPVKYAALKVAQSEIESLWPPATEAVRDAA